MIEVKHLTKRYGSFPAVSDLSFSVGDGGIYGFLGANGAGKTTTMNMMTGCLAATSGEVKIGGFDIFEQPKQAKRLLGYLPEIPPIYLNQTPREYLTFVAEAKGIARGERKKQVEDRMEMTQISEYADSLCSTMSKGYRQRVGIAQALLGNPEIVILDEPTVGLDPRQTIAIRELIQSLRGKCTVLFSSHILSEVQAICDHILILSHGKLVAFDSREDLIRKTEDRVRIELDVDASPEAVTRKLAGRTPEGTCEILSRGEGRSTICLEQKSGGEEELCRSLFFLFAGEGTAITRMDVRRSSLEEIFIRITEDAAAAAGESSEDSGEPTV